MLTNKIKELLSKDISKWRAEGWIDNDTYGTLAQRYEVSKFGFDRILKYLGIIGGIILLFGILGLMGVAAQSLLFGVLMCGALSVGSFLIGLKLYKDALNRFPFSSKALFVSAMLFYGGSLGLIANFAGMSEQSTLIIMGLLWIVPAFFISYYFVNNFILVVTVLLSFHWFGSWHRMFGRSTYAFSVQDPKAMIVFALIICAVGIGHDLFFNETYKRFYKVYVSISLLYFNNSLLILSIFDKDHQLVYVIAGFLASLGQIIVGSRLQRNVFTGFGVTFFGIHLFTRYHEIFWDTLHKGVFFLTAGLLLLAIGILCEWINRKRIKA